MTTDGDTGKVVGFYFDDQRWAVRHLIGDTISWAPCSDFPFFFWRADCLAKRLHLALTRDKIKHGPDVDLDRPVCRRYRGRGRVSRC